jgi:hypothetical protein
MTPMSDEPPAPPAAPLTPEVRAYTVTREYPASWPDAFCAIAVAWELVNGIDMRPLRHYPEVRRLIWPARKAARSLYRQLLKDSADI